MTDAQTGLDTFITHVKGAAGVDADWRTRVTGYAATLRASL